MSDDPVQSLENLAELHRRGDLNDAEFAQAKSELLGHGAAASATRLTEPMPSALAPAPPTTPARSVLREESPQSVLREESPRSKRAGISFGFRWKVAVIALVVLGFVLGIASLIVAEVAPSSAQWTKGLVCASGEQLVTNGGVVQSNGGSAQGATHFYCAPAGQPVTGLELLSLPEQTGSVLGLSFLLGFLIAAVLTFIGFGALSMRARADDGGG